MKCRRLGGAGHVGHTELSILWRAVGFRKNVHLKDEESSVEDGR
jgi:hypothetical protein